MRKIRYVIVAALAVFAASCSKDDMFELEKTSYKDLTLKAWSAESEQTKTVLQEDGISLWWNAADQISVFYGDGASGKFVSDNKEPAPVVNFSGRITSFSGQIEEDPSSVSIWAVYPHTLSRSCDGENIVLSVPAGQQCAAGVFPSESFPMVAKAKSLDLPFYNVCGGFKFSVKKSDIRSVIFSTNAGDTLAGLVKVGYDDLRKVYIDKYEEPSSEIVITPAEGDCFVPDKDYFVIALPCHMSEGFMMKLYTTAGKMGVFSRVDSIDIKRSRFGVLKEVDKYISEWTDSDNQDPGIKTGIYLGITGFNQTLYKHPVSFLSQNNIEGFSSFISNTLVSKYGTLLYYGMESALDDAAATAPPVNLGDVAFVTFTDGLDQGSLMMNPNYETDEQYLSALGERLRNDKIHNCPITAWAIGVKGSDVTDEELFRKNLNSLSTTSKNAYEVSSLSEANAKFEDIARILAASKHHNIALTIPGAANGTRIRFTFDGVSDASSSSNYIEGTFELSTRSLKDIKYYGMISSSGDVVNGETSGIFVTFKFDDVCLDDRTSIVGSKINQWNYVTSKSIWQKNSEFGSESSLIETVQKSTMIMLLLDCSSSLGTQFATMQESAINFLNTIYYTLPETVSLSPDTLTFAKVGESRNVVATVSSLYTSSIIDGSVTWSSSDELVAKVDANGNVTAVSPGRCTIFATTRNGVEAACHCKVIGTFDSIVLSVAEVTKAVGSEFKVEAQITPEFSIDSLVWASSDTTVAKVSDDGIVTALSGGKCSISAGSYYDASVRAECKVNVVVVSGGFAISDASIDIAAGSTYKLTGIFSPSTVSDQSITWSSSDENVATVSSDGTVTAKNAGVCLIRAKSAYGDEASCKCSVHVPVTTIALSQCTIVLQPDEKAQLSATITPSNATDKAIQWTSSNRAVAAIDDNGLVTALGVGESTITASTKNGVRAECKVFVSTITLSSSGLTIEKGTTSKLTATVLPDDLPDKSVAWSSSDASVASVDDDGNVSGVGVGSCTITATTKNGLKAECKVYVASISLSSSELTLAKGTTSKLTETVLPDDLSDKSVTWSSSDASVASVDDDGNVSGIGVGSCTITATTKNGLKAECKVSVFIPITSITLSSTELNIEKGGTSKLTATILPSDATDRSVTWSSSDTNVASVDNDGNVTGVGVGSCTITVTTKNGLKAECKVSVFIPITSITLSSTELNIEKGATATLTATILPSDATHQSLTWSSNDVSVASVDENGNVSGVGVGNCTITATTKNGLKAECKVSVFIPVTSITLSSTELNIEKGATATLTATILPSDATDRSINWSTSDANVANVDSDGKISAVNVGSCTITAITKDGGKTANCIVNVWFIPVTGVSLNESSIKIERGGICTLVATIAPSDASDKTVTWSSSNTSIAAVSPDGVVTGKSVGEAKITAMTKDGGKTANCIIEVMQQPEIVDLGLSVKWRSWNIGASEPEEYGTYFAYGDVVGQTWNGSSWSGDGFVTYPVYELDTNGNLKPEYDAAHVNLGGSWRMPTSAELWELKHNCKSTWTNDYAGTGVAGRIFTSNKEGYTNKFIFLPAAGSVNNSQWYNAGYVGSYRSSTFHSGNLSWDLLFDDCYPHWDVYNRNIGVSIRPVSEY